MDLLGPFPSSASGNKWIIVATDYLTHYAETKAAQRATAYEVAHFIDHIVLGHDAPSHIADRGTAFTAQLIENIFKLSCTQH